MWALTVICLGAVAGTAVFAQAVASSNTEMLNGLTIAVILVAATIPIAFKLARLERDATLVGIVMAGVVAKFLGSLLRYYVSFEIYGNSDSAQYHRAALSLVGDFRRGIFDPQMGSITGTKFIKVLSGGVYTVFGVSRVTAFFVFAWLGFLGLLLVARAFRIAVPEGDWRRYLILVLFVPSLVYWPSSMGKEAWMMVAIGLCAYGVACILRRRAVGYISLALGLVASGVVRPHIGLLVFLGLVFALLVRRAPARSYAAPMFRLLGLVALLVLGLALASQTADFLGQPNLTTESVSDTLDSNEQQTADGGSEFTPVNVDTPIDMVPAFVTVFFRPFPFEVSNAQGLLSAAECVLVFGLFVVSWKRVRSLPRLFRARPYLAFCVGYVLVFVYAFSSFSNFGILARQRVQALPFLLVILALPDFRTLPSVREQHRAAAARPASAPDRPVGRRRVRRPVPATATAPASPPAGATATAPASPPAGPNGSAAGDQWPPPPRR